MNIQTHTVDKITNVNLKMMNGTNKKCYVNKLVVDTTPTPPCLFMLGEGGKKIKRITLPLCIPDLSGLGVLNVPNI